MKVNIISKKHFKFPSWCKTPSDDFSACKICKIKEQCNLQINYLILADCNGFYYTYKLLLKETIFPIFTHSQKELEEKIKRNITKLDQPQLFYTIITNGALAVELAMKYLIFRQKHEFKEEHKLNLLFESLPLKDKNEILERIKQTTGKDSKSFRKSLEKFSEVFVKARYFFAHENKGINNLFDSFVQIVCDYANEIYKKELP